MRLTIVCAEIPFPANHGGRVDTWNRIKLLVRLGYTLQIIYWSNPEEYRARTDEQIKELSQVAGDEIALQYAPLRRNLYKILWSSEWEIPRLLSHEKYGEVLKRVRDFKPQGVLLEGLFGYQLGSDLAKDVACPIYYRSQNVEQVYYRLQLSRRPKSLWTSIYTLGAGNVKKMEERAIKSATAVFDISEDDCKYWQRRGFQNVRWLPPNVDLDYIEKLSEQSEWQPTFDIGFVGNLYAPNNVEGLIWFATSVLPIVRKERPELKVFFAGKSPCEQISQLCKDANILLVDSPESVLPWFRAARVFINPVQAGSGVNIKAVEMLFSPAHLVTRSEGVQGLPAKVSRAFNVADNEEGFARHILAALAAHGELSTENAQHRLEAKELFTIFPESILLDEMKVTN